MKTTPSGSEYHLNGMNTLIRSRSGNQHTAEFEHFKDFTIASAWERFISEIEAVCRQWLADGAKNLVEKSAICLDAAKSIYKVRSELKYSTKNYIMDYYFEPSSQGRGADWITPSHDLQQSFGVKDFLVIAPQSASGVVLDAPEASKLLSAVAIALSNCASLWPAFVPVHDPSRRAYIGIQNMGTIFTRRFEADRIGSQVPIKLMHLEGLYELFVSKFAYSTVDLSMHLFEVHFKMKLTYRTLPTDDDDEVERNAEFQGTGEQPEVDTNKKVQWDYVCPWSEWYSAEDPAKGLELITVWSERSILSSLDMAELENASPFDAEKWLMSPNISLNLEILDKSMVGFASQLHLLVNALDSSLEAQYVEDFVSVENSGSENVNSSAVIPPPTVLDRVLKELLHDDTKLNFVNGETNNSQAIKGAPLNSLFAQFCLHALWFGNCNIRAIAVLWIEFVHEIRWYWEELQPLPRMPTNGTIDLSTCLIHQKLQMFALCIEKLRQEKQEQDGGAKTDDDDDSVENSSQSFSDASPSLEVYDDSFAEYDSKKPSDNLLRSSVATSKSNSNQQNLAGATDPSPSEPTRKGSAGVVGSMMLLKSQQQMHAPLTQNLPLMTEDMHEERLQAVEALGDSFSFSAQLEKETLSSDMSAFKAANPDAVFEDFIRWHSPRDWENDDSGEPGVSQADANKFANTKWPPRGRLSKRMSDNGNSWRKIWNDAPAVPVSEQKPLFDPKREGEKVLHYLETVRPHLLLEQMVCTAFKAAADTLNHTDFGGLKLMKSRMEQLYVTMASALKFLQRKKTIDSEHIEDLKRLCDIFKSVEQLLITAASLHLKFLRAPRLSEEIFNDFYKVYLPRMGTGAENRETDMVPSKKHQILPREREVVAGMFTPPTANQSWRKVLSMGNLLNGHEPILREIIFSKRDHVSGSYYAGSEDGGHLQEIETYRMYMSGTSNDISVALAVASCD
ncbi:OLC1v1006313C1 [Oldenlandia corymbosa var. corymbosa]|uniref:Rab3 GTPase-activating protein catalytic subunit n=1 Tax=Oldenlandia corymbosa var. corymbosa TaxID=529605 RepID=A0AAV1DI39_OLDCO|nr:OLC1v1006313C1 [Oldenlandia corymbosa var. corymbosa]